MVGGNRDHNDRSDRYRAAQRELWMQYGLEPDELNVDLPESGTRIRVQVLGSGPPVVLVHGGLWPGAVWAPLLPHLRARRCYVVDRPGCGLSPPIDWRAARFLDVVTRTMTALLDALGLKRALLVGHSIGGVWVTAAAVAHPERVRRLAIVGATPLLDELRPPAFLRLLASPVGALISRLAHSEARARAILRQDGHGASLQAGRIPDAFLGWHMALTRETGTLAHERAMIRATLGLRGWRDGATDRVAGRVPSRVLTPVSLPVTGRAAPPWRCSHSTKGRE